MKKKPIPAVTLALVVVATGASCRRTHVLQGPVARVVTPTPKPAAIPAADARAELEKLKLKLDGDDYLSAIRSCKTNVVRMYLAAAMNPAAENQFHFPPLKAAVVSGCRDVANLLLDAGVSPNNEVLFFAAFNGMDDVVKRVLKNVDVNARKDPHSDPTALHGAAAEGHLETVKVLVAAGADLTAKMMAERTPSDRALEAAVMGKDKDAAVLKFLLSKGAPLPGVSPSSMHNALMIAADGKSPEAVRILIAAGLPVNQRLRHDRPRHRANEPECAREGRHHRRAREGGSEDGERAEGLVLPLLFLLFLFPLLLLHLHLGLAVLLLDLDLDDPTLRVDDAELFGLRLEVLVAADGHSHERYRHGRRLGDGPAAAVVRRAVPAAVAPSNPVPAIGEEHFLVVVVHHENAGLDLDDRRRRLEANCGNADLNLNVDLEEESEDDRHVSLLTRIIHRG